MNKKTADTIITTHNNADLDAVASMVAASYLYPEAVLINPSIQVRSHSNEFIKAIPNTFKFVNPKDFDFSKTKNLVVVDTRQRSRLLHISPVLQNSDLIIHAYDHHPDAEDDLKVNFSLVKPYGSTVALIIELLKEKKIQLVEPEPTLLALGLYEDTGSFKFNSTTVYDFNAAAWLIEQGIDFNIIQDADSDNLSSIQVNTLNSLLQAAEIHNFKGISVTVSEIVLDSYLVEFSTLVQKMVEMEKTKVLFAIAQMADKIQLVARSSLKSVNVANICKVFGGGGHSYAASASVSNMTLPELKEKLLSEIFNEVQPQLVVNNFMASPALSLNIKDSISYAENFMGRYGLKAAPVINHEKNPLKPIGIIEYHTVVRAKAHLLGSLSISDYINRNILSVSPDDDLDIALNIIINNRQRLIPVIQDEKMVGVITRTDIINTFMHNNADYSFVLESNADKTKLKIRNVSGILKDKLPKYIFKLLKLAGELGDELGFSVYVVGGFVRDLLMAIPNHDIDLCVEGNGIVFAHALGKRLNASITEHIKFKTAILEYTVETDSGEKILMKIDIATSRLEYYESPGALPNVEHSSIRLDLYRRDFTINAVALELNQTNFGNILDFYGAQRDIKNKIIQPIHSLSFIEDPTRIIRAILFEVRLNFKLSLQTERLINNAIQLGMIKKISGQRIFHGFQLVCEEENTLACLKRMDEFKVLQEIHPILPLTDAKEELILELEKISNAYEMLYQKSKRENWVLYLLALCLGAKYLEVSELLKRLMFSSKATHSFLSMREQCRDMKFKIKAWSEMAFSPQNNKDKNIRYKMSMLADILNPLSVNAMIFVIATEKDADIRKAILYYITKAREEKLSITGKSLIKMGMSPGVEIKTVLKQVLDAKIDGLIKDKQEELNLAESLVKNFLEEKSKNNKN
ncbi:CBS domain-containing protein [Desulfovibrio litoralis]|uniref:tRNA nucleotidyltransferase (CCA-adding enzyme) n=1 Tax=Desulfovibrio litoralis DSM 11393 TaxID=1121455 RepID=A0A1M7T8D9_9BACT|nr:CBS domain-containing protein [Desulfovibrio litoralis]SHN66971.1 tRNA nucleotidyltransferase (CCA-adding enzyme) [Desulfovibrio litoralis DSM 11393]